MHEIVPGTRKQGLKKERKRCSKAAASFQFSSKYGWLVGCKLQLSLVLAASGA
jgi:hypothetical protein